MPANYFDITAENVEDFPAGTKLTFHFGAMYPTHEGVVTGYEIVPATKWFPPVVRLTAVYDDHEGGVVETTVSQITNLGIGTYLRPDDEWEHEIDNYVVPTPVVKNEKSKWFAA